MPPFNVISRRSTPEIVISWIFQNSASKMVYYSKYCQLSYVFTGKLLATRFNIYFLSLNMEYDASLRRRNNTQESEDD